MLPTWLARKYREIFFAGLLVAYLVVLYGVAGVSHEKPGHSLIRIMAPAIELGFFYLLCSLLAAKAEQKGRFTETFFYLAIPLLADAVYTAQIYSLFLSDNLITVLAIENTGESRIIRNYSLYVTASVAAAWWLFFLLAYVLSHHKRRGSHASSPDTQGSIKAKYLIAIVLMLSLLGLHLAQKDTGLLEADYRQSPGIALLHSYVESRRTAGLLNPAGSFSSPGDNNTYPLEKSWVYQDDLPFKKTAADGPMNMIVIFTEGTSARLIGAYGGKYPGLTPNIDRLSRRSMRVINYYNHTAATYRGLQGQLVSGYPWAGGESDEDMGSTDKLKNPLSGVGYRSVPMILRDRNYRSYFLSPHFDSVGLNTLLRSLGFDKVFSFEDVSRDIVPGNPLYFVEGALSDGDIFKALRIILAKKINTESTHPFFIGLYNFGTHSFLDVIINGVKYGDGKNPVLNRLHNYDYELGRFLDYFLASDYAKNTILVFTSDHADFPDQPYRDVAGAHYLPVFVDRVPLLIYDPSHSLPALYDVHGRTSIDLAPSLLQLLGIRRAKNSFLGTSLFERESDPIGFAAIGNAFYATDAMGIYPEKSVPGKYKKPFADYKRRVENYYRLEKADRVFDSKH